MKVYYNENFYGECFNKIKTFKNFEELGEFIYNNYKVIEILYIEGVKIK